MAQIRFDATLDGDNPLQSKVFSVNPRKPSFDTDLAWSMNKPSFDALVEKNAKVHVKVQTQSKIQCMSFQLNFQVFPLN